MYYLKAYVHQIAPITEAGVQPIHFRAIDASINTLEYLKNLLGGKLDCSSCGVVQFSDQLILDRPISKRTADWIEERFPFISTHSARRSTYYPFKEY